MHDIARAACKAVSEVGYFFERVNLDSDTRLLELAQTLGIPSIEPRDGVLVKTLQPTPRDVARLNTLSSRYGFDPFPFHTETAYWGEPARWLLLYCESPGQGSRATRLADVLRWNLTPAEEHTLRNEVWRVRRPGASFFCVHKTPACFRFDAACMEPANSRHDLSKEIVERHLCSSPVIDIAWKAGHLLVVDNWRILHARGTATKPDADRRLKKVLVRSR